jgi:hypothetical protein
MEGSRAYSSRHFKNYAFIWKPELSSRQEHVYRRENSHLVDLLPEADSMDATLDIVKKFVYNGCDDEERYLSRALVVSSFIATANINRLRSPLDDEVSEANVLIDDRNNENVTRVQSSGNCRPFRGPLNAHQLYTELCQEVSFQIVLGSLYCSRHFKSPSPSLAHPVLNLAIRRDFTLFYFEDHLEYSKNGFIKFHKKPLIHSGIVHLTIYWI